ncbi:hypothetical protein CTAYLR_006740 [Chrysophaeum taylorii]|uniref:CRAL-TRIO domain-containing protein n=1 Tax=Chrysophaeum taylorii TaxID=2483200 RepID=A0AAD7UC77_9STRA|nr:hypothetical protein CTAYLR_006740 [Chrysophaeum taylorii]
MKFGGVLLIWVARALAFQGRQAGLEAATRLGTTKAPMIANVKKVVAQMRQLTQAPLSDDELAWFARDRGGDPVAAVAKAEKYASWRRGGWGGLASDREGLKRLALAEAKKRVGYLAEPRDVLGRPVVTVVAKRHMAASRNIRSSQALCIDVLESAIEKLGDDAEQFVAIVDLRHCGTRQVDIQFLIWLVTTLRSYYPKRLGQVALVDPPTVLFQAAWSLVTPYLGKHADLVRIVPSSEIKDFYFHHNQIPHDLR